MKQLWGNSWFAVPVMVFFIIGLLVMYRLPYGAEILYFNAWRNEPLNTFFRYVTMLGEPSAFGVAIALLALMQKWRFAALVLLTGLATIPVQYYIKDVCAVDRPITYFEAIGKRDYLVLVPKERLNTGQTSYPSGHTTGAFVLYSLLTLIFGRTLPIVGLVFSWTAILVALSRVFLVQHFVPDVLAGAVLGMVLAHIFWGVGEKVWGHRNDAEIKV
jgi:membrane-associated phospholipid phosphatase